MRSCVLAVALGACGFRPTAQDDAGAHDAPPDMRPDVPAGFVPTSPRKLTFDNTASTATLQQFQVLVALDSTTVDYSKVGTPVTDLAFEDASMTKLPFEVETWNPEGESDVWVRVPQIPAGTSSILMYFGSNVGVGSNPTAVWSGYDLVAHFTNPLVSSSGMHAPTAHNVAMMPGGRVSTAVAFPGTGDEQVNFASAGSLFDAWNAFTLGFSIYADYPDTTGISGEPPILDKGGSLDLGRFYKNATTTSLTLQIDLHFQDFNDAYLATDVPLRTWTDILYTYDGTSLRLYNDGVQAQSFTVSIPPEPMLVDAQSFYLGDPIAPFTGMLDELRISQAYTTRDWALAVHRNLARAFVTIGDP